MREGADIRVYMGRRGAYLRSWSPFYEQWEPHAPAEFFRPVPLLQERVEEITHQFHHAIGVHIRRGDHKPARKYSPTAMFMERVRAELERVPDTQVFLATDDPEAEAEMRAEFGKAIVTRAKASLNRAEIKAQQDAVVDLYCLAATQRIYGSFASSFSRAAAELGGIPRETVSLHQGEPLDW